MLKPTHITPDTGCLECNRPHASVNTTTPKIDRKHMYSRNMLEIRTRYIKQASSL